MAKKKISAGQPTKYKPEYCQKLIDHMATGLSYETFGAVIDVATSTIYLWEDEHPEFSEAKKIAFNKCRIWWESHATDYLVNSPNGKSLNASIWIFNMKNRFKWTDRQDIFQATTNVNAEAKGEESKELIEEFRALLSNKANERK